MEKASARLNKGENSSTLKLIKSSIVFTNSTCDVSQSSLLTHEREQPLTGGAMMMNKADHGPSTKHKFSSIFNKIKSAFSNKVPLNFPTIKKLIKLKLINYCPSINLIEYEKLIVHVICVVDVYFKFEQQ